MTRRLVESGVEARTADKKTERDGEPNYRILSSQNRILNLVAKRSSLQEILDSLCLLVEQQSEGAMCSILLVNKDGSRPRIGAGLNIPQA